MTKSPHTEPHTAPLTRAPKAPTEARGCRLVVVEGESEGALVDLSAGSVVIGSGPGCDLTLTDCTVSGQHARVEVVEQGIRVTDLKSTNGTFYLGTGIHEGLVPVGAILSMGRAKVAVQSQEPKAFGRLSNRSQYGRLLGESVAMRRLYTTLERIEGVDYTVLVTGETGVGKELVAREIHDHSSRAGRPFEVVDCGTVSPQLAESAFFGHTRGAFTGAIASHEGAFMRAQDGTVFLDEVGELSLELQPKLLRVLESRELRAVGGARARETQARVVAATNRNLELEVERGAFREDLYFRLNVVTVAVPPLRDRREDIPSLVRHFVQSAQGAQFEVSAETIQLFTCAYHWPGNVRELRNAIARMMTFGTIPTAIPGGVPDPESKGLVGAAGARSLDNDFSAAKRQIIDAFEVEYLSYQLERSGNNIARAARQSGVDRTYFKRMLRRHGLMPKRG